MRQQPGTRHPAAEIKALTSLRGIAAMAVVMQHFSATAERHSAGWIPSLVPHGYMAVDFFFVLSGFIMSYTYLASFQAQGMQAYVPFLLKRVARIVPLGLAVLAAILLCAGIASFWGHQNWFINPSVVQSGLALPVLINILHIQGFIDGSNLNGPSWSISVELGAYLLFPAFIWLVFRGPRLVAASALLAGAAVLVMAALTEPRLGLGLRYVPFNFARCCIEFCFGMGIYALYRRGGSLRVLGSDRWTWAVSAAAAGLLLLRLDLPLAFLFPWLILAWAWNDGGASRVMSSPVPYFLGTISFSLYLIHDMFRTPELELLRHLFPAKVPPAAALAFALGGSLSVIPFAALTYRWIERPGRDAVNRLTRRRRATAAPSPGSSGLADRRLP